jgi:hypothetical protein
MGWAVIREMPSGQVQLIDQLPLPSGLVALDVAYQEPEARGSHAGQGGRTGLSVLQALYRGLASSSVSSPASPAVPLVLASWGLDTEAARQQEPVIGVEFKVGAWHQALRSPLFVPGDTDVF